MQKQQKQHIKQMKKLKQTSHYTNDKANMKASNKPIITQMTRQINKPLSTNPKNKKPKNKKYVTFPTVTKRSIKDYIIRFFQ